MSAGAKKAIARSDCCSGAPSRRSSDGKKGAGGGGGDREAATEPEGRARRRARNAHSPSSAARLQQKQRMMTVGREPFVDIWLVNRIILRYSLILCWVATWATTKKIERN